MKKRTVRTIHFRIYQKQADIISKIEEEEDLASRLRELINKYGSEAFPETPAYAEAMKMRAQAKVKEEEAEKELKTMSNEKYCTRVLGGKVSKDGESCCFLASNNSITSIRLSTIKTHTADEIYPVIHKEIMNKTFVFADGKQITDEQWERYQKTLIEA